MEKYVIIVAGGSGTRFGAPTPKQYVELCDVPIIIRTLQQAQRVVAENNIVTVIPESDFDMFTAMCNKYGLTLPHLARAGESRFHSVKSGLRKLTTLAPQDVLVAVHDGVRPFASAALFNRGFKAAMKYGAAVPCIPMIDSVRAINDTTTTALKRDNLRCVQTPQVFQLSVLANAYNAEPSAEFTDDASVVEAAGGKIEIFDGDIRNIKITNPIDRVVAEYYLSHPQE
ncbi:MAG: 2-C-methyl-D-erythritol 4-phosphate cytidylyltransferase [Muribaculaceae bacterium]|nr:2-C-methyl-D-erythritol 4-phosphate cytidylyltransferase [Muribaculaceae bacterium]